MLATNVSKRNLERDALLARIRRRKKLLDEIEGPLRNELARIDEMDLARYREGLVGPLLESLTYAGKCPNKSRHPFTLLGREFCEDQIMSRVRRFVIAERESVIRKVLRTIAFNGRGAI